MNYTFIEWMEIYNALNEKQKSVKDSLKWYEDHPEVSDRNGDTIHRLETQVILLESILGQLEQANVWDEPATA